MRTNSIAERAEVERPVVGPDLAELGRVQQPVLVELRLHEPEREPGRDDVPDAHLAQRYGQRADVILVPCVSTTADHVSRSRRYAEVGKDQVDAEMLVAREREPGVDDDRLAGASKTVMFLPTSPRPPSGMMRAAGHSRPEAYGGALTPKGLR